MQLPLLHQLSLVFSRTIPLILISLLLGACGGGGSKSEPGNSVDDPSGRTVQDTGQPSGYLYYISVYGLVKHDVLTGIRSGIDLDSAWSGRVSSVSVSEDSSHYVVLDDIYNRYAVLDRELNVTYENSTNGIYTRVPLLSPDKTAVVYGWERNWYDDEGDKIKFDSLDGSTGTRQFSLFGSLDPEWVDNSALMYLRNNSLYKFSMVSEPGNEIVRLIDFNGSVTEFALSPGRDKVAFILTQEISIYRTLHVVNLDGSNEKQLTADTSVHLRGLSWSPDGQYIAVGEGQNHSATIGVPSCPDLYLVPVNGDSVADLHADDPAPAIHLAHQESGVWVYACFGDNGYNLSWRAQ